MVEVAVNFKQRLIVTEDGRVARWQKNEWNAEFVHVGLLYDPETFLSKLKFQKKRRPALFKKLKERGA